MTSFDKARTLIQQFKGARYLFGFGVLRQVGQMAYGLGRRALLIRDTFHNADASVKIISESLISAGIDLVTVINGAAPNAPREDLARITAALSEVNPDLILSFGGGSTIDAAKAAGVLHTLGGHIDDYFGTGRVTEALSATGKKLTPHIAVQTAASSGAHLTKYSNITDLTMGQKKLIVDNAIVPERAVFDYRVTLGSPSSLTVDGALDGIAHLSEVLLGAVKKPYYPRMREVAGEGIRLILEYLPKVQEKPDDSEGREALGLATDLGAYAIMLGGTNGPHLTSFSLIDVLSHGRACGMLNPYYTVFFAPAVQEPLKLMAGICRDLGYADPSIETLSGRRLGEAVAQSLIDFEKKIGVPTTLGEVPGFSDAHIERALAAAKDPQLRMKLENMPVPLTAEMVDTYMGSVLQAAKFGELHRIRSMRV